MSKSLLGLLSLFFLSFTLFATMVIFRDPISQVTRAKEDLATSAQNTVVLAYPLRVKADGAGTSKITVFVRSINAKPLSNKIVSLTSPVGLVTPTSATTDKEGKAEFEITSTTPGVADLTIVADNLQVTQKVSVKFE